MNISFPSQSVYDYIADILPAGPGTTIWFFKKVLARKKPRYKYSILVWRCYSARYIIIEWFDFNFILELEETMVCH